MVEITLAIILAFIVLYPFLRPTKSESKPVFAEKIIGNIADFPPLYSEEKKESSPLQVQIVEPVINPETISESTMQAGSMYKPQTFKEFIGQEQAKNRALTIVKKAQRGIKCHLIVQGIPGHGKTTFVEILGKTLGAKIIERIGAQITEENIIDLVNEINTSPESFVMLFVDEIDTIDPKVLKIFNPIIETNKLMGKRIRPFIFAGATINKHKLIKNNPDTLDRIPEHITFDRYNVEEMKQIIQQYKSKQYPYETVGDDVVEVIAKNAKFNPRIALALLDGYIVERDIQKILKNNKVVKDGLTETDVAVLRALEKSTKPLGSSALAQRAKLGEKEYLTQVEPFLCEYEYIIRVPMRALTEKGREFLTKI